MSAHALTGSRAWLLIDAGNTRLKWRLGSGDDAPRGSVEYRRADAWDDAFALPDGAVPAQVWVSSVAGNRVGDALKVLCRARGWPAPRAVVVERSRLGLTVAYRQTKKLGVDRWLAMLGARATTDGAVCVADVGTALTLDCVAGDGEHLGGVIAPGADTMARALLDGTAGIGEVDDDNPLTPFGRDTGACVRAGAVYACAALIDRFARECKARLNASVPLLLTGGGRHVVAPLLSTPRLDVPELVLDGLLALAEAAANEIS